MALSGVRMADGKYADGSWELNIKVTDMKTEDGSNELQVSVLVTSDLHIGGVIAKLVDTLKSVYDVHIGWSDYELWWPDRQKWLDKMGQVLGKYEVQADAKLIYTPKHKVVRIQLPDLQYAKVKVNFAEKLFFTVKDICKFFDIRHPEELSIMTRKLENKSSKKNLNVNNDDGLITTNVLTPGLTPTSPYTPGSPMYNTLTPKGNLKGNSLEYLGGVDSKLLSTSSKPSEFALRHLFRPKSLMDKANYNIGWLDSFRCLMEQGVEENSIIYLRFKYFAFFDLDPKYDSVRINQLYEQAKWSLVCEELDCTEEEMIMFASLQYHITKLSEKTDGEMEQNDNKDIDQALKDLEGSLGTTSLNNKADIMNTPELSHYLKLLKPKKFTLKGYKKYYFIFKDTNISYFKTKEAAAALQSPVQIKLKGAEVVPDVSISENKYVIKLFVPGIEGMQEYCLKCDNDVVYCKWIAACKLAAKGHTMADASYDVEVQNFRTLLKLQKSSASSGNKSDVQIQLSTNIEPEYYVARRHLRRLGNKTVIRKIQESVTNYSSYNLIQAKLAYIKAWGVLPEYGLTHFSVKFSTSRKEEMVAVAFNRIIRMDPSSGEAIKTWRFNSIRAWSVNWDTNHVVIELSEENKTIKFSCNRFSPKLVHETIGGYIFCSMRTKDADEQLDAEKFFRLTGGWHG